jgi:DnaJ domain
MDGRRARIVLGVGNDAGPSEIRRAFRARALATHPDHGGDRVAFAELTDALAALDPIVHAADARPPAAARPRASLAAARPPFDAYDSARRPTPRRNFADALQAATARLS